MTKILARKTHLGLTRSLLMAGFITLALPALASAGQIDGKPQGQGSVQENQQGYLYMTTYTCVAPSNLSENQASQWRCIFPNQDLRGKRPLKQPRRRHYLKCDDGVTVFGHGDKVSQIEFSNTRGNIKVNDYNKSSQVKRAINRDRDHSQYDLKYTCTK